MSSSNKSFTQRLTPECNKMAKRSMLLNSVGVFFAIVSIILIIIALVYTYMETTDEEKARLNRQIAGGLIIATLFTVIITALVGIWNVMVNKGLQNCIGGDSKQQNNNM